jgi:signal transduction histidine kinase
LEEKALRLKEALAELEHMSYSIMHDMRAPLRAIVSFGDLILAQEGDRLRPESLGYLQKMQSASARMDHLICDVLNYSVIARANLPLGPVDIGELLRGMIDTYPELHRHKAHIHVSPGLPLVQGNEGALTQCFSNLLGNAIKFARPDQPPRIQVAGECRNGWVRISVEDNGVGIAEEMQERIFGIFQRGTTTTQEGTGIGLAIVRKAAERMGGRVGVVSELGKGSRFWIELRGDPSRHDLKASTLASVNESELATRAELRARTQAPVASSS